MGGRHDRLQKLYDRVRSEVKEAVDEADPEGLLAMGAPPDEYDDAVTDLTRRVLNGEVIEQDGVERWFLDRYGLASSDAEVLVARLGVIQARALGDE